MNRPAGAPCWTDLLTSDTERASRFYTEVFGWTAGEGTPEYGGYFMFMKRRRPGRGMHAEPAGHGG